AGGRRGASAGQERRAEEEGRGRPVGSRAGPGPADPGGGRRTGRGDEGDGRPCGRGGGRVHNATRGDDLQGGRPTADRGALRRREAEAGGRGEGGRRKASAGGRGPDRGCGKRARVGRRGRGGAEDRTRPAGRLPGPAGPRPAGGGRCEATVRLA